MRRARRASPADLPRQTGANARPAESDVGEDRAKSLRRSLLRWWDRSARPLPWRADSDSYRIWISEVMLQQTRIAVVLPAYERFIRAFPGIAALARASEDEVLSLWSGLGYYSRARSLHRAARALHGRGAREFPRDPAEARTLPGVGAYTVAAVQSIAYGAPLAAVDGNVIRVLARLERLARPDNRGEPHASIADRLLARDRAGDWNQALMELGETICTAKAPRCDVCPLATHCRAHAAGVVARHPPPKPRRAPERVRVRMTIVHDRAGRLLLERGAFPFLTHLWLPPARVAIGAETVLVRPGRAAERERPSFRHAILHRQLDVHVTTRLMPSRSLDRAARAAPPHAFERRVVSPGELARIGRSALLTKALRAVDPRLRG
jgi:A/G-specific adenine glycosylase